MAGAKREFAVALPAGRHVLVVWAENTEALLADLAPGRTYFVEVSMKMGFWSARAHLYGITPRSPSWGSDNFVLDRRAFEGRRPEAPGTPPALG